MRKIGYLKNTHAGFALLELLIALAIFSIIATVAYGGLNALIRAQQHTLQAEKTLKDLQLTVLFIERDISATMARTSRDQNGIQRAAVQGDRNHLALTTSTAFRAHHMNQSRVIYALNEDTLQRSVSFAIDQTPQSIWQQRTLLSAVQSVQWRYLANNGKWQETWPPQQAALASLPRAVEVRINSNVFGDITRIIPLARGFPVVPAVI